MYGYHGFGSLASRRSHRCSCSIRLTVDCVSMDLLADKKSNRLGRTDFIRLYADSVSAS